MELDCEDNPEVKTPDNSALVNEATPPSEVGEADTTAPTYELNSAVVEVDRNSNESPMFNDPSPQQPDTLASSSGSEDALKSLEKLENLARLAENAALEDRDVDTPQSFVNADDDIEADSLREVEKSREVVEDNPTSRGSIIHAECENDDDSVRYTEDHKLGTGEVDSHDRSTNIDEPQISASQTKTKDKDCRKTDGEANHVENTSCQPPRPPVELQQQSEGSQISTDRSVVMATSYTDANQSASPVHETVQKGETRANDNSRDTDDIDNNSTDVHASLSQELPTEELPGNNDSGPMSEEVIDAPLEMSSPASGKRPVIIEDEQTGNVTVSYGDELVHVELNTSSGDEFSDMDETEEQRILRKSGAQIIEDDDDDEEDELQALDTETESNTRPAVIDAPVEKNIDEIETPSSVSATLSPDGSLQKKRKESKLEQSIRKISNIREKASITDSVQLESIGSNIGLVQNGNRTDMTVKHNIKEKGPTPGILTAREAAVTLIESDSENEMVIDERSESERVKQRKGVSRKRSRPEQNDSVKVLGTVEIFDSETSELSTKSIQNTPGGNTTNRAKQPDADRLEPITIEPSVVGPPPLIADDVIVTSVKLNADSTAFKPSLRIKQEKEDIGYNKYQQLVRQPLAPPPYRHSIPMTQRQPIGFNLSTGEPVYNATRRPVGGGMMRSGQMMSRPTFNGPPAPPAYSGQRPLGRVLTNTPNSSPYNSPIQNMNNIVMSQGNRQRMSQALVNVVMPGAQISTGTRPETRLQQPPRPSVRIMGPRSLTNTTTVPVQILNTPITSGATNSKSVTVVIPPTGSLGNTSSTQSKAVNSVPKRNTTTTSANKKASNVKAPSTGILNVGFIKKLSLELPTYTPPSPPEKLSMNDVSQYTCSGCQDKFLTKASLDWHRARQSMLLTFTCRRCQKHITFSNKCALLSHISSHGIFYQAVEKALNEGNLIVKPLHSPKNGKGISVPISVSLTGSATLTNGKPVTSDKKPSSTNSESSNIKGSENISISKSIALDPEFSKLIEKSKEIRQATQQKMSQSSKNTELKTSNDTNKTVITNTDALVKRKEIKILPKPAPQSMPTSFKPSVDRAQLQCAECGKHVPHHAALKAHFSTPPQDQKQVAACRNKFCNLILPTQCARDAHERYTHFQGAKPHVCPECGVECGNNLKVFRKHLSQICFHLCRAMVYCCPKCSYLTKLAEQIVQHAVDTHGEKYHKCLQCPMAFKSRSTFVNHCKNSHDFNDGGDPNAEIPPHKAIFKCPMCDTVFHKYQPLQDHLVQHYPDTKKVQRLGYQCPRCETLIQGSKTQLMEHLKSAHNVTDFVTHMCHICGLVCASENEKDIHIIQAHQDNVSRSQAPPQSDGQKSPKQNMKETETEPEVKEGVDATKTGVKESIPVKRAPICKPGPVASMLQATSPTSSVESASSNMHKPTKRRAASPVMELVTGARNAGQRTLCNRCGIRFESDVDYTKHMRIHESRKRTSTDSKKGTSSTKKNKIETPDEKPNVGKLQVELEKEPPRVPCTDCDMQFMTEEEREKHMQSEHAQVRQFPCQLCGLTYLKQAQLDNHIQTSHEGKVKESNYTCWICLEKNVRRSYQKRALLESHLRSTHKIPRNQIDFSKMPEYQSPGDDKGNGCNGDAETASHGDESVVKRLRVDGDQEFTCAKCNYTCNNRDEFQAHITKHKSIEEDALQCHECGMSFMVLPSLKRHLFMVHKIRNMKKYQEESGVNFEASVLLPDLPRTRRPIRHSAVQNGYSSRESDSTRDSDTELDGSPIECNICYKEFENEILLRKHMRLHGMAFIRSRRLDPQQ